MTCVRNVALCILLLTAFFPRNSAYGQNAENALQAEIQIGPQTGQFPIIPSRIDRPIDNSVRVQLTGNTHPSARAEFDKGAVDSQFPMQRMTLLLTRSPEQEAALQAFMERQLDPKSPDFHHWLEPDEFGSIYGPSEADVAAVTNWLTNNGFTVDNVSKSRLFIDFSGTAGLVARAFHTEMHRYNVNGEPHIANNVDPSIPQALSPVVTGIFSLNDFFSKPLHHDLGSFRRDPKTGKWTPLDESLVTRPLYDVPSSSFELVSPYDFAAIYNVLPLWNAGIDGTGQTIAIAGRSDINLADIAAFRSAFGLPPNVPTVIVNGADPGVPSAGDRGENSIDIEWSGAVAKGATIKFVTTKSTHTSDGASASAQYIIDHKTAPIMSFSYGNCELAYGKSGNTFYYNLWQQAAAQGITAFVASGDQAAAACDGGQLAAYSAHFGLAVSGAASTPYNVSVGGTDFNWPNLITPYWNSSNAANGSSATGYIPEVPWNSTCANDAVDQLIGATKYGWDEETTCQQLLKQDVDIKFVNVVGGTGGKSACTSPTSNTVASCAGGYAKPSWQAGVGVPADGKRDVPDLALFAANGALNTAYAFCDSQSTPCTYSIKADAYAQAVGGTSVSSPAMAGIMALINQKAGSAQGNANANFYALAAQDNRSACNTVSVGPGNTCNFYDITTSNIAVPCSPGTPNCTVHHSTDYIGILDGYSSTAGYDLATGLGSVNAYNLANHWDGMYASAALSVSSLKFPNTLVGLSSASQSVTLKNTGSTILYYSSIAFSESPVAFTGTHNCGTSLAPGASCTLTVTFKPPQSGSFTGTLIIADNAAGAPHKVALSGAGYVLAPAVTFNPTSLTFPSTPVGVSSASRTVTMYNTGTASLSITSIILAESPASFAGGSNCGTSLAIGASCSFYITFKPPRIGALTGALVIRDNAANSPQSVPLTGTGR